MIAGGLPNKLQMWQGSNKPPSFNQVLTGIKYIVSLLEPYGFGNGGYHFHEMIRDLKVYALFRHRHKDCRIQILRAGQKWPEGAEIYIITPLPTEVCIKSSWDNFGVWIGGYT